MRFFPSPANGRRRRRMMVGRNKASGLRRLKLWSVTTRGVSARVFLEILFPALLWVCLFELRKCSGFWGGIASPKRWEGIRLRKTAPVCLLLSSPRFRWHGLIYPCLIEPWCAQCSIFVNLHEALNHKGNPAVWANATNTCLNLKVATYKLISCGYVLH